MTLLRRSASSKKGIDRSYLFMDEYSTARLILVWRASGWPGPSWVVWASSTSRYIVSASAGFPCTRYNRARLDLLCGVVGWRGPSVGALTASASLRSLWASGYFLCSWHSTARL